jgi:hypothetical protein
MRRAFSSFVVQKILFYLLWDAICPFCSWGLGFDIHKLAKDIHNQFLALFSLRVESLRGADQPGQDTHGHLAEILGG